MSARSGALSLAPRRSSTAASSLRHPAFAPGARLGDTERVPVVSSYHYLLGPMVAVAALGLIMMICRWVFSTDHRDDRSARRLAQLASAGDYGLLVPISTVRSRDDALMLRSVLREAGIRASVSADTAAHVVLVFRADAARARQLVAQ